ncbi:hypothetical protein Bbelb_406350 [Branchiostoma belcheri]|nr:hypothetical protein Bbelb_406350 [Branchiostoma belcheri]
MDCCFNARHRSSNPVSRTQASTNLRLAMPNFDWALVERGCTLPGRKIAPSSPLAIFCAAQNFRSGRRAPPETSAVAGRTRRCFNGGQLLLTVVNGTLQQSSASVTGALVTLGRSQCGLSRADLTEQDLILNRSGRFGLSADDRSSLTVCPNHRKQASKDTESGDMEEQEPGPESGDVEEQEPQDQARLLKNISLQFQSKLLGGPNSRHFFPSTRATHHPNFVTPACLDHEISKPEVQLQYHNKLLGGPKSNHFEVSSRPTHLPSIKTIHQGLLKLSEVSFLQVEFVSTEPRSLCQAGPSVTAPVLDTDIKNFMEFYRREFPSATIPIKMHLL